MKQNYIGGRWVDAARTSRNINPSNLDDVIGEYASADAGQARDAVGCAESAFDTWAVSTPAERFEVLDQVGTELIARKSGLGGLLAREEGKTVPEAIAEVHRAGQIFKFFAGEALRIQGERLASVRPGIDVDLTREPLGAIGIITPWNFPIAIPAWKIAPALAYGNCVVFKPADSVPGSAWALTEIISRTRLHRVVTPHRHRRHPRSVCRGDGPGRRHVARRRHTRPADADRTRDRRGAARPGSGVRADRDPGGRTAGGRRRAPGAAHAGVLHATGAAVGATNAMRSSREEIFGPVASVIRVRDFDGALATANDTEFGLTSGICTTTLRHATRFKRLAQAGMVMVNVPTAGVDFHVPFGGRKGSSFGPREQGRYAADFYTVVMTAYTAA